MVTVKILSVLYVADDVCRTLKTSSLEIVPAADVHAPAPILYSPFAIEIVAVPSPLIPYTTSLAS